MHIPSFPLYQSGQVQSLIALACETPFCLVAEVEAQASNGRHPLQFWVV